ncbi:unnamed protein product [Durusdinium trenchii]|uniref:protein-serine/threonine phosphatase n=1 Tax=Durusdinium trenchii TaxID=1381693 RepID=A0ABP0HZJ5_9DINO
MVSARVDYLAARYVRLSIWLFAGTRRKEGSPELLRLKQRLNLSPQEVVEPLCKVVEAGDRRLIDPIATDSVFAASDLSELMKHYDQLAGYDPDNREVPQDTLFCGPVEEERRGWNWKDGNRRTKRGDMAYAKDSVMGCAGANYSCNESQFSSHAQARFYLQPCDETAPTREEAELERVFGLRALAPWAGAVGVTAWHIPPSTSVAVVGAEEMDVKPTLRGWSTDQSPGGVADGIGWEDPGPDISRQIWAGPVGQRVRQGRLIPRSLVVVETIDHKPGAQFSGEAPDHPTEKQRIETAGGTVSFEDPPRLDGSLAVSRGLGDFEYKADGPEAQGIGTVSCIPDIYEVSSLAPGTLCILGCDGIWDVRARPGRRVAEDAGRVRPGTTAGGSGSVGVRGIGHRPGALADLILVDLGDIAAEILRQCLQRNSRDNMTCMIMHFADGSDWANFPDEMKNYDKLLGKTSEP